MAQWQKFRKKPVVIAAVQYHIGDPLPAGCCACNESAGMVHIHTLEGSMTISDGDWIICGVKGEHYPCKPDIFAATYEQA